MTEVQRIRLEQDLAYYQSLLADQLKQIEQDREQQRQTVSNAVRQSIPSIESLLTPQNISLLRLYRLSPTSLSIKERKTSENLSRQLEELRGGGCINLPTETAEILRQNNRLFRFNIPKFIPTFCIDVFSPLEHGFTNVSHNMVDLFIGLSSGENLRYPLDEESSKRYFDQIRSLGVDPTKFPQMRFPEVEKSQEQLEFIMLQLYPMAFGLQ